MNKVIFLDRDGTINVDYGYVGTVDRFKFIDGVIEALKILYDLGYMLIVVSNQSGVGRGFFSKDDVEKVNQYMLNELKKEGVIISAVYYCPHIDSDNCECRKPKLKLFYDAINDYDIDINCSYAIGDKERDLAICDKENIKGILLTSDVSDKYICKKDLLEAAKYIRIEHGVENEK